MGRKLGKFPLSMYKNIENYNLVTRKKGFMSSSPSKGILLFWDLLPLFLGKFPIPFFSFSECFISLLSKEVRKSLKLTKRNIKNNIEEHKKNHAKYYNKDKSIQN